jgi:hypothetical protein
LLNQFPTYSLPYIPDEWLVNATDDFILKDLKSKLQSNLVDLVRIPFVRGSQIFKSFLEMDANYIEDDNEFDFRRTAFMSGGMGGLSTTLTSGRSSVLNPFMNGSQQLTMVNARTYDGRRSVTPTPNA